MTFPARSPRFVRWRRTSLVAGTGLVIVALWLWLGELHSTGAPARAPGPAPGPAAPPAATVPDDFAVSGVTASSATLSWAAAPGAIAYRIYRGPAGGPLTLINTTEDGDASYTATNLRSASTYSFAVASLDIENHEARTATTTVVTPASRDTTAPAAPAERAVSLSAFSSSRVDVTWAASTSADVAYYEVLREDAVVGTVDRPSATKFSDNTVTATNEYSYQVRAVDSAGNRSPFTAEKSITTPAAGTVKIVRGPYALQVDRSSALIVWWSNVAGAGSVAIAGSTVSDAASTNLHKVRVTGLTAGTAYPYTVHSGAASAGGTVRTAALSGTPFTFAVIADYGAGNRQESQNAAQIRGYKSDFLQTVGDNIYSSSGFSDPNPLTTYSDFDARIFKYMGGVLGTQAFFPANGNHDYYTNGEWWTAFPMAGPSHSYYSYNWGDAHILVLDSMLPFTAGSAQYSFARSDLASPGAKNAKWRIVVLPRPPYNATASAQGGSADARSSLVPLFESTRVDLVLSADAHNYQRSYPLLGGRKVTDGGITYVVTGGGGNGLNTFTGSQPSWQAARAATFETLKVNVSSSELTVSAIAASGGTVLDTVTLRNAAITHAERTAPR